MPKNPSLEARFSAVLARFEINPSPELLAALAQAAKPVKEESELQKMTGAILEVCKWTEAMWGRAARTAKKLVAVGVKPEDIRLHYGPQDPGAGVWWWWRKGTDFRNKGLNDALIAETCGLWEGRSIGQKAVAPMPQPTSDTLQQAQWLLSNGFGD